MSLAAALIPLVALDPSISESPQSSSSSIQPTPPPSTSKLLLLLLLGGLVQPPDLFCGPSTTLFSLVVVAAAAAGGEALHMDNSFNFPNLFVALTETLRLLELCLSLPHLPSPISPSSSNSPSSYPSPSLSSPSRTPSSPPSSSTPAASPLPSLSTHDFLKNPLLRVTEREVVYIDKQIVSEMNSADHTSFQDKDDTLASKDTD